MGWTTRPGDEEPDFGFADDSGRGDDWQDKQITVRRGFRFQGFAPAERPGRKVARKRRKKGRRR